MTEAARPARLELIKTFLNESPYYRFLGMRLVSFEERGSRMELEIAGQHLNAMGIAHGGSLAGLVDSSCGTAAATALAENEVAVTLDLRVQFFEPAKPGPLSAKGWVVHRTRRHVFAEAEVHNSEGRLVCRGSCIHSVIPPKGD